MKKFIKIFLIGTTLLLTTISNAQDQKSFTIENISKEVVWPAVFSAFKELKLPRPLIATKQGTGETSYYNYTSLMIKNRFRFKINYQEENLTISIFERQYYTKSGWADNPLPMSKKKAAKILNPIKEGLIKLTKNKIIADISNNTQTNEETINTKKSGIYEDFIIVKTGIDEMDLLAIHENGSIIGFDLSDDKKTVKSLIFKEKEGSEEITMLFDEKGSPKGMVTDHLIINIPSIRGNIAELVVLDLKDNTIGKNKIELPVSKQASIKFLEGEISHGPSSSSFFMLNNEDYLSKYIGTSSTITKAVACGAGIAGGMAAEAATVGAATPLVIVGVVAACESIYFDLVARYVGEDHFMFKELNLASDISSIISVINPLDTNKWVNILSISNDAIPSLKNAIEGGIRLFNKSSPKPIITPKNENQPEIILAESNASDKLVIIKLTNEAIEKITVIEKKIKGLREVANETNYQKIAIDIQKLEKKIDPIKLEYTNKIKKIAQKRTIKYSISKSDKEESRKNYNLNGAEVMDFRWGKYGGPSIEIEIFFSPIRTFKTIDRYQRISKFQYDLRQFSFSFEDGSEKPTKYALIIGDKIRNEGKVKTAIGIKLFEKEIKTLNFYGSNAKTTKID